MSAYLNLINSKEKKTENECEVFEDNSLYIHGFNLKCKVMETLEEFKNIGNINPHEEGMYLIEPPTTDDIYIKSVEEDIEDTIVEESNKVMKKKIFQLHKGKSASSNNFSMNLNKAYSENSCGSNSKSNNDSNFINIRNKTNHLRNEAQLVEEAVKEIQLKNYDEYVNNKFKDCKLVSHIFYNNYYNKKEIGKENNYIFNFNDNYLNDISEIDRSFFIDYFNTINPSFSKIYDEKKDTYLKNDYSSAKSISNLLIKLNNEKKESVKKEEQSRSFYNETSNNNFQSSRSWITGNKIINYSDLVENSKAKFEFLENNKSLELLYSFAIYHPLKNTKTQEIEVLGSGTLRDLKDKIYCVLDELNEQSNINNEEETINCFNSEMNTTSNLLTNNTKHCVIPNTNGNPSSSFYPIFKDDHYESKNYKNDASFFFIENCFYNDMRKTNFTISIKNHPNSVFFKECEMGNLRIDHIDLRVGYPYLFRHQEYCDHMVMVTNIRILDNYDLNCFYTNEGLIEKSIVTFQKKIKRRLCDFCGYYYSK